MPEDEMVGWHYWLNGHEFKRSLGDSEGQESLACYSPWGHRVTENWATATKNQGKEIPLAPVVNAKAVCCHWERQSRSWAQSWQRRFGRETRDRDRESEGLKRVVPAAVARPPPPKWHSDNGRAQSTPPTGPCTRGLSAVSSGALLLIWTSQAHQRLGISQYNFCFGNLLRFCSSETHLQRHSSVGDQAETRNPLFLTPTPIIFFLSTQFVYCQRSEKVRWDRILIFD